LPLQRLKLLLAILCSPLAPALIGKQTGDIITVLAPAGTIEYEIADIRYQ